MISYDTTNLKRLLVQLPKKYNFKFEHRGPQINHLKNILYFSLSKDGTYLPQLFPEPATDQLPTFPATWNMVEEYSQHYIIPYWVYADQPNTGAQSHEGRVCGKKFNSGDLVYHCQDCGTDDTCVICENCFNPEIHEGHNVSISISSVNSGICDCGDDEAWNQKHIPCKLQKMEEWDVPDDLKASINATLEVMLDYILDVMATSDLPLIIRMVKVFELDPDSPEFIDSDFYEDYSDSKCLNPSTYGYEDPNSPDFVLILWNDEYHNFNEASSAIRTITGASEEKAKDIAQIIDIQGRCVLATSTDLLDLCRRANSCKDRTKLVATIMSARDYFREEMCTIMLQWILECINTSLPKISNFMKTRIIELLCGKYKHDENNQGVSEYISSNLIEETIKLGALTEDGKIPYTELPHEFGNISFNASFDKSGYLKSINQLDETNDLLESYISESKSLNFYNSRFQIFCYFDPRFTKSSRTLVHELCLIGLSSNPGYKELFTYQYLEIYHILFSILVFGEREPELSPLSNISAQLLTSASLSNKMVEYGAFSLILKACCCMVSSCDPLVYTSGNWSFESTDKERLQTIIRASGEMLNDVRFILERSSHIKTIATRDYIMIFKILMIFQGTYPVIRRQSEHVLYESIQLLTYRGLSHFLYEIIRNASYIDTLDEENCRKLIFKAIDMYADSTEDEDKSTDMSVMKYHKSKTVTKVPQKISIFKYDVSKEKVSMFHTFGTHISYLIERFISKYDISITEFLSTKVSESENTAKNALVIVAEYALRSIVFSSQISCGLWVRNGINLRAQMIEYQEGDFAVNGYQRDIFLVQMQLCNWESDNFKPDHFIYNIIDRWGLLEWFINDNDIVYHDRLSSILEEFFRFLLNLIYERPNLYFRDTDEKNKYLLKRALINVLCHKPLSYSDLDDEIDNQLSKLKEHDEVLQEITNYIDPTGISDVGVFKLKPKYFEQIDPYSITNSQSNTEKALGLKTSYLAKKKLVKESEIVLTPKLLPLKDGPYEDLLTFTRFEEIWRFIVKVLTYDEEEILLTTGLFGYILEFCHIAAIEDEYWKRDHGYQSIVSQFMTKYTEKDTVLDVFMSVIKKDTYRSYQLKFKTIVKALLESSDHASVENLRIALKTNGLSSVHNSDGLDEVSKRKRIGEEQRRKVMEKFSNMQKAFLDNNNNVDDDDEDMASGEDGNGTLLDSIGECIVCKNPPNDDDLFGVVVYAMDTYLHKNIPMNDEGYWIFEGYGHSADLDCDIDCEIDDTVGNSAWQEVRTKLMKEKKSQNPGFPIENHKDNVKPSPQSIVTGCGHGMHFKCFQDYYQNNSDPMNWCLRRFVTDPQPIISCPLCKALATKFIPIFNVNSVVDFETITGRKENEDWNSGFDTTNQFVGDISLRKSKLQSCLGKLPKMLESSVPEGASDLERRNFYSRNEKFTHSIVSKDILGDRDKIVEYISNTIRSIEISLRGRPRSFMGTGVLTDNLTGSKLKILQAMTNYKLVIDLHSHGSTNKGAFSLILSENPFDSLVQDYFNTVGNFQTLCQFYLNIDIVRTGRFFIHLFTEPYNVSYFYLDATISDIPVNIDDFPDYNEDDISKLINIFLKYEPNKSTDSEFKFISDKLKTPNFFKVFYKLLYKSATQYLRQAAIFAYAQCSETWNKEILKLDLDDMEGDILCKILQMPRISQVISHILEEFTNGSSDTDNEGFSKVLDYDVDQIRVEYPGMYRLVPLQKRLDFYLSKQFRISTEQEKELIHDPERDFSICLQTGEKLEFIDKRVDEGGYSVHPNFKSEYGIHFVPKTDLIFIRCGVSNLRIKIPGPYLNSHGDHGNLRSDHLLYLSEKKYEKLRQLWLQHEFPALFSRNLAETILNLQ